MKVTLTLLSMKKNLKIKVYRNILEYWKISTFFQFPIKEEPGKALVSTDILDTEGSLLIIVTFQIFGIGRIEKLYTNK